MMGDPGLRVPEAAGASRPSLAWIPAEREAPAKWEVQVVGKGDKERFVPVTAETVARFARTGWTAAWASMPPMRWQGRRHSLRRWSFHAGHASLQTTSVYVTAEERRRRAEIARYTRA
jgi:hypothetical protein